MVTKLDILDRSLTDARAIADEPTARQIRLSLGGPVYDPDDAVGRLLSNPLAMVAEHSTAQLADLFGVGRSTIYRAMERNWVSHQLKAGRSSIGGAR